MYIRSIEKVWSPWFKQIHTTGKYKGKDIHITSNYINDEVSFKMISVMSADEFRVCHKEPFKNRWHKITDLTLPRKRK